MGNYILGLQQLVLQTFPAPGHHCVFAAAPALSGTGLAGREEHLPREQTGLEEAGAEKENKLNTDPARTPTPLGVQLRR